MKKDKNASESLGLVEDVSTVQMTKKEKFRSVLLQTKNKYAYLSLAAIIPAILFLIIYLTKGHYPFGNGTTLVLDLNEQYIYFFAYLRRAVLGDVSLLYSFSRFNCLKMRRTNAS